MIFHWRRIVITSALLCIFTSAPQIADIFTGGRHGAYVGRITSTPADTGAYFSNIEQARQGRLLFENQLTSEPQRPSLFHPLWLVTGWLAALGNLSTPLAFNITRLLGVVLLVIIMDALVSKIFPAPGRQNVCLAVLYTSAGLGWTAGGHQFVDQEILRAPIDLWIAESNTWRTLTHSVQFIVSQLCLVVTYWVTWEVVNRREIKRHRLIGPLLMFLGLIHPYDLFSAAAVMAGLFIWYYIANKPDIKTSRPIFRTIAGWWLWVVPVVIYYFGFVYQQPAMRGWLEQNININATPGAVLVGYGLLIPLAAIGGVAEWRRKNYWVPMLIIWAAITLIISYTPGLSIQRRLLNGVHIPLALLAGAGLWWLAKRFIYRRWQTIFMVITIALMATTNAKHIQGDVGDVLKPSKGSYPLYIDQGTSQGIQWLKQHSRFNETVFSDVWPGNTITGLAGRTVVMAHGNQTIKVLDRLDDWEKFRAGSTTDQTRQAILDRLGVVWLWWTPDSVRPNGYQPADDPRWDLMYQNYAVSLYRRQR